MDGPANAAPIPSPNHAMIQLFPPSDDNRSGPAEDTSPRGHEATAAGRTEDAADLVMARVGAEAREPDGALPWVYANMIVAADGATAVDGVSGGLGGDGDRMFFRALRAQADIILVGAGTARAEGYRPPLTYEAAQDTRRARGQQPRPRLALVTRSLNLDPDMQLFEDQDPETRPFVVSSKRAWNDRGGDIAERAEPIIAGIDEVDLADALNQLRQRGFERVLCEGGPSLNGELVAAGLVDEWNLTIAPLLAGGDSKRAAVGPLPGGPPPNMTLDRVWLHDDYLFCRWIR